MRAFFVLFLLASACDATPAEPKVPDCTTPGTKPPSCVPKHDTLRAHGPAAKNFGCRAGTHNHSTREATMRNRNRFALIMLVIAVLAVTACGDTSTQPGTGGGGDCQRDSKGNCINHTTEPR